MLESFGTAVKSELRHSESTATAATSEIILGRIESRGRMSHDFMLKQMTDDDCIGSAVGIAW
jgi:hypothetical protein